MEFVAIEGMVLMEVGLVDIKEGGDCVDDSVNSFVGSGCSRPPLLFF